MLARRLQRNFTAKFYDIPNADGKKIGGGRALQFSSPPPSQPTGVPSPASSVSSSDGSPAPADAQDDDKLSPGTKTKIRKALLKEKLRNPYSIEEWDFFEKLARMAFNIQSSSFFHLVWSVCFEVTDQCSYSFVSILLHLPERR